ncbi:beta-L-arabinofuranosidase domain-containing protein [Flavihumibacter stibioxidans]|uniref:Glycosyl hydrolase n=1 Tax=Flavihumibacter stibioxidans TaxID=1834163 RepID=A0ABR7MAV7_9BACT|nr:glycoside hydrolase family 127 protein [Flavihumibacter stibioxidans]MBC6491969.1 glycosyl hydrolase [Flavihumibacter stibioxidans]
MRLLSLFICTIIVTNALQAQPGRLQYFPISAVRLSEGPFKAAQETDKQYILSLSPDRLLAPYLKEAGLTPKAASYGNWENTGLDGHIGGHYLSALSMMYAATGDNQIKQRLDYMLNQLAVCQEKNGNGYLSGIPGGKAMWEEIRGGRIDAGNFGLNGKWVPLYNIHKIFAGLLDAYSAAESKPALAMLVKLTDWMDDLTKNLSDEQVQNMLISEHGGLNEVFAELYSITRNLRYLNLAEKFSDRRILTPLLEGRDQLTGLHANTQIPKVIGYDRIGQLAGKKDWSSAAAFFWYTVTQHRTVSIGGNSVREHFHPANDFSSMLSSSQGPETCNSYNMLKLTKSLFQSAPNGTLVDYYERTLYNHILSSQHPKGGFVYFTPMRPGHYRVYSQAQEDFWCCVGSGLENHSRYGEMIYAHNEKDLFINLYIPSSLEWKEKGLRLEQNTRFPYEEKSSIRLKLQKPMIAYMHFRYPSWAAKKEFSISVNGKIQPNLTIKNGFVSIHRNWKNNDVISIRLPMETSLEYLPDGSEWASFVHGPIVLGAITDTTKLTGLWGDGSRMGHVANGPLLPTDLAPIILKDEQPLSSYLQPVAGQPLHFSLTSHVYPNKYTNIRLVPFYTIHEARYMVYWPVTGKEQLPLRLAAMKAKEDALLQLENQTIDQVAAGEQQPESDHQFAGEQTQTGLTDDRYWREATGFFSYVLKNTAHKAHALQVTFVKGNTNTAFDLLVNDSALPAPSLEWAENASTLTVTFDIPAMLKNKDTITIRFQAKAGSSTPRVREIRLLKRATGN